MSEERDAFEAIIEEAILDRIDVHALRVAEESERAVLAKIVATMGS